MATGALGLGFGASVMTLNTAVEALFPDGKDRAVLVLNALLGVGTASAPLLVAAFTAFDIWWALPLVTAGLISAILVALVLLRPDFGGAAKAPGPFVRSPRLWLYLGAALLYGVVETLCGNWASLYLSAERGVNAQSASLALTAFWLAVTVGRVLFALLGGWAPPRRLFVILPAALAIVFQLVVTVDGAVSGIAAFAAAGLACSALLPLSISLGGGEFPEKSAAVSGRLIALYQIGYGVAVFGVGPLRQWGGLDYASAFSLGSVVAVVLCALAIGITRRRTG